MEEGSGVVEVHLQPEAIPLSLNQHTALTLVLPEDEAIEDRRRRCVNARHRALRTDVYTDRGGWRVLRRQTTRLCNGAHSAQRVLVAVERVHERGIAGARPTDATLCPAVTVHHHLGPFALVRNGHRRSFADAQVAVEDAHEPLDLQSCRYERTS